METTTVNGTPCRMFYVQGGSNRQLSALAVGASAALIALEIDDAVDQLPRVGAEVHLVIDGRLLHTTVHRSEDGLVTVVRPDGVEFADLPEVLPARAGFATTVRAGGRAAALSGWVLDISVRATRVLGVIDPSLATGSTVEIELDGRTIACRISAISKHRHPEHAIYHLEFATADLAVRSTIVRLLGVLRVVPPARSSWGMAAAA